MKYKYYSIILTTFLLPAAGAHPQSEGLAIGDAVPSVPLKMVHPNGPVRTGQLSAFFDRLLILDFMYSRCGACIEGLPKKAHLQRQFGDRIKVLVVVGGAAMVPDILTQEDETYVKNFLANEHYLSDRQVEIPWVVENERLNELFPHEAVSHLVWIYKGRVVAITGQDYVDHDRIQMVLDGRKPDWPVKDDAIWHRPLDEQTPLIQQATPTELTREPSLGDGYAAVFDSFRHAVRSASGTSLDPVEETRRIYYINLPVINVYAINWNKIRTAAGRPYLAIPPPSHILTEVSDSSQYVGVRGETSYERRQRTYISYESVVRDTGQSEMEQARAVIRDLSELFGVQGRFERRLMKCLVLVADAPVNRLKSKGGRESFIMDEHFDVKRLRNVSLSNLVHHLNQYYENPPVLDNTGIEYRVDMDLEFGSWTDIPAIRAALQEYGLDLKPAQRELEVFVLTETTQ